MSDYDKPMKSKQLQLGPDEAWKPAASVGEFLGAAKNDSQKPDLSLVPYVAIKAAAEALMVGEKKYGRYNYCKGHKSSQLTSAALRHLFAYINGEERDPVDGQLHLGSVLASISMLLHQAELGTLKDDRFTKG